MYAYASREELNRRVVHSDLDRTRVRGFKSWESIIIPDTDGTIHRHESAGVGYETPDHVYESTINEPALFQRPPWGNF